MKPRLLLIATLSVLASVLLLPTMEPEPVPTWIPVSALEVGPPVQPGMDLLMGDAEQSVRDRV
jgi:hypothetical protein